MSKKELIRVAAVKIIADEGFFSATTDKIAKESGMAVGTIYNYFSNKEDILRYILDVEFQKRYELYQNVENSQIDPLLKIEKLLN
ncbi:MAG: helix-turn-helix transcriptional regulator, partial [Peptostreptococcaceae bacterium]|nr:helix-turn-helix transcriptional regulator [Peptostreptococcaceae bacterium]